MLDLLSYSFQEVRRDFFVERLTFFLLNSLLAFHSCCLREPLSRFLGQRFPGKDHAWEKSEEKPTTRGAGYVTFQSGASVINCCYAVNPMRLPSFEYASVSRGRPASTNATLSI